MAASCILAAPCPSIVVVEISPSENPSTISCCFFPTTIFLSAQNHTTNKMTVSIILASQVVPNPVCIAASGEVCNAIDWTASIAMFEARTKNRPMPINFRNT